MKEKLNRLSAQANELNNQMHQALIEVVKSQGGFIRTNDDNKFGLYAVCCNEFTGDVYDERILGVAVFGQDTPMPELCVLVIGDKDYCDDTITDEEMLDDSHWLSVIGEGIITTPTLIELCNGIYDFIEQLAE